MLLASKIHYGLIGGWGACVLYDSPTVIWHPISTWHPMSLAIVIDTHVSPTTCQPYLHKALMPCAASSLTLLTISSYLNQVIIPHR